MTPQQAIASLEAQLAMHGETVTLRRYTAPSGTPRPKTDVAGLKAFVRPVRAEEMIGAVKQNQVKVILSPAGLAELLPLRTGDKVLIAGAEKNIEFAAPIRLADTLVRIELTVMG